MGNIQQWTLQLPHFTTADINAGRRAFVPPVWWNPQQKIVEACLSNQGGLPAAGVVNHHFSLDPGGQWMQAAHFPLEAIDPKGIIGWCFHFMNPAPYSVFLERTPFNPPRWVDQDRGDRFFYIAEGATSPALTMYPFVAFLYEVDDGPNGELRNVFDILPYPPQVALAIEGRLFPGYGPKTIRDHSYGTHQPQVVGDVSIGEYAAGQHAVRFGGDGCLKIDDMLHEFRWPAGQDFSVEAEIWPDTVAPDTNGSARNIFSMGNLHNSALFTIQATGRVVFGPISSFSGPTPTYLRSTTMVDATKFWHVQARRVGTTTTLSIDGVVEDTRTNDTTDYSPEVGSPYKPVQFGKQIGDYGRFVGWMRNIKVTRPY